MRTRRSNGARRRSPQRTRKPRTRAYKHARGFEAVCEATQRVLIAQGYLEGPVRPGWRWRDFVPASRRGSPAVLQVVGLSLIVLEACAIVEDCFVWHNGPLAALLTTAEVHADRPDLIAAWLRRKRKRVVARIQSAAACELADLAYNAGDLSGAAMRAKDALEAFEAEQSSDKLAHLVDALRAMVPRPVAAEFYGPGKAGSKGHFANVLRDRGLEYEQIATILDVLKPRESCKNESHWKVHRASAIDSVKRSINNRKVLLRRQFGDESVLGKLAQNFPLGVRVMLLLSVHAERDARFTVSVRSGGGDPAPAG